MTLGYYGYKALTSKSRYGRKKALRSLGREAIGFVPGIGRTAGKMISGSGNRMLTRAYKLIKQGRKTNNSRMVSKGRSTKKAARSRQTYGYRFTNRFGRRADIYLASFNVGRYFGEKGWRR